MKLETFFEKFDLFADAPDAVAKMRELVLELAIMGRLVPNAPSEAAVPYKLVMDATPINTDNVPSNWRVVILADAIKNRSGNSKLIKGKLHKEPAPGRFQGFSASGADVWCDDYEHEGQAIIISAVGARCGKAFKAAGKWSAIANTNIAHPEPTLFDFDFAYLVLDNEHFWVRGGSAQPFVKFPPSLDRHFALPPLAEQQRIVAKVDELMALCDQLESQQQERETRHAALARASLARFADAPTQANLNILFHSSFSIHPSDLRKSILTLAVQGKLVPQDPNDEPAETLAARIGVERVRLAKRGKVGKSTVFAPIADAAQPYGIPESWAWVPLGNVTLIRTGKLDANASSPDGQYPFFTCAKDPLRIDRYAYDGECVLLAGNGNFDVNYYDGMFEAYQRTYIIEGVSRDMVDGRYLFRFIQKYADTLREMSIGGVISYIKIGFLTDAPFPLPPLAEQRRIVAKVDQLMGLVDELETQLATSRATGERLLAALVAELTAGKESHTAA